MHLRFWFLSSQVCKAGVIIAVLSTSYSCYRNQARRCLWRSFVAIQCSSDVCLSFALPLVCSVSFLWTKIVSWDHELYIRSWKINEGRWFSHCNFPWGYLFYIFSKMIKYNFFFLAYHLDLLMGTILALCELTCLHTKSLYTRRVEVSWGEIQLQGVVFLSVSDVGDQNADMSKLVWYWMLQHMK